MKAQHEQLNVVGLVCGFLLSAVALAGGVGPVAQVAWPTFPKDQTCTPQVVNGTLKLGRQAIPAVSAQMKAIFDADQAERQGDISEIDWAQLNKNDLTRQQEVLKLLTGGKLSTGQELLGAAFVFQHGNCPNHFLLANALAKAAIGRGNEEAKWISAAAMDRYLMVQNKPQKYGTQFMGDITGCNTKLYETDTTTTDAERAALNVPTLAQAKARAETFNSPTCKK